MIFKFALRNFKKRLFLNLIKITGLSLAFGSLLFIALFLKNELSYDKFFPGSEHIYRLSQTNPDFLGGKEFARIHNTLFLPSLSDQFPEVESYVRLAPSWSNVKKDGKVIHVNQSFICDTSYFQVFETPILSGHTTGTHNALYLSESMAKRLYGHTDPIGQTLEIPLSQYGEKTAEIMISGIMKDNPQNSHFHPEMLYLTADPQQFDNWAYTYLRLSENADPEKITKGFKAFLANRNGEKIEEVSTAAHLQKITDIHLDSHKLREIETTSSKTNVYVLALSALILLFIALSNYISLNAGMASFNDKYFYINTFLGSSVWTNIKYILSEGLLILGFSAVLSLLLAIPGFRLIQQHFSIDLFEGNSAFILLLVGILGMLTLFAGVLPALATVSAKTRQKPFSKQKGIHKGLIVLQYAFSVVLIVAVIVISRQTDFVLKSSLGSQSENIISIHNPKSGYPDSSFETFKTEVEHMSTVKSISAMFEKFGGETNDMFPFELEGFVPDQSETDANAVPVFVCDHDFIDFFHIELMAGQDFSDTNRDHDGLGEFVINESALHFFNYTKAEDILGKSFAFHDVPGGIEIPKGKIIGVVKDFYLSNMKSKVRPLVLFKRDGLWLNSFVVEFQANAQEKGLANIKSVWEKHFPNELFDYQYSTAVYRSVYKSELLQARLLSIFTLISLFICSMGLLGLSLLITQRRIKEVGIRKVNGAKAFEIMRLLNWDFIKWVILAYVLGIPVAYLALRKWLQNFAYQIDLDWWIFGVAGLVIVGISLLTVSWESWKASMTNPVKALRYE
ncbi:ABC transporter permease [Marinilongibacter aquaticus]|uniref:ABC transporter permease n=1 Tax=Marinilongibacter aquaticus TaxID=2975157 RepID=UPI0021BD5DAB|nr:ABC transporter permease [Marinilongibacter aquaticus]UBM60202.1 ABC transporter permease [Marinilongibacter aquaticus]